MREKTMKKIGITTLLLLLLVPAFSFGRNYGKMLVNLGAKINSECNELNPVISPDGNYLYFCRDDCGANHTSQQDIWFSARKSDGSWSKAIKMPAPLNNDANNFVISVAAGGKTLLLGNVYHRDGSVSRGISMSHNNGGKWSYPEEIKIKNYYNNNDFAAFYLASDGRTLLMAIERDETQGEKDLYVSFREKGGTWSEPQNLGRSINTDGNEMSPFLAADGITLYFSTDGRDGIGSADVYMARRIGESWTEWTDPENLGPDVNTPGWDACYKTSAAGDYAYLVSSDDSYGKSDIFRIEIPEKNKPKIAGLMKGYTKCYKRSIPVASNIFFETLPDAKESAVARSTDQGDYSITLPSGNYYSYRAEAEGYLSSNEIIDLRSLSEYKEFERDIDLIPAEDSLICIRNIFFATNQYRIPRESYAEISRLIDFMKEHNTTVVEISGFTDSKGSAKYNLKLSKKRANYAKQYLLDKGIDPERIIMMGFGNSRFAAGNDTEEDRALNRRVEFKVYEKEWQDLSTLD